MAVVNTGTVLNKALNKIADNSPELRAKALVWLNEVMRDILNQPRKWAFLSTATTIAIANNQITLPEAAAEIVSIQVGDTLLTPSNQMTPEEAFSETQKSDFSSSNPGVTITFIPSATGTATVIYERTMTADYADNADTIFPKELENLCVVGVRKHDYDYDKDGRYTKEEILYDAEMRKAKAWDNRQKPLPRHNPHGYLRT